MLKYPYKYSTLKNIQLKITTIELCENKIDLFQNLVIKFVLKLL